MVVHWLHSVCVALNSTGWMWTSSPWFVCLFMTTFSVGGSQYSWVDVDELTLVCMLVHWLHSVWVALNTTGWMWTSSPWFVCLFIDYIQCGWPLIQPGMLQGTGIPLKSQLCFLTYIESNICLMWMVCSYHMGWHTCTTSSRYAMLPQYYYCWHNYSVQAKPVLSVGLWNFVKTAVRSVCVAYY